MNISLFNFFTIDLWTLWGLIAQGIFFSSFVYQWYKSEKMKESHLPLGFWYLRITGSLMLFVYVLQRQDFVFFLATIFQVMIYIRNIILIQGKSTEE